MKNNNIFIYIVFLLSLVYFVSQFLRSALGIIAINISQEFQLNYEQLGRLGGIFFLSFALMQIPLGIILDKYNPIKLIFSMLIIVYIATLILSFANSFELVFLARTLQGIGCSVFLMGPLVYLAKNSPKNSFSKFSGVIMGVGGLGALFAFGPFYHMNLSFGWQNSFLIFSFFILIVSTMTYFLINTKGSNPIKKKNKSEIDEYIFIFSSKNFLMILPISIFGYASFAFLLTLWGSKFLILKDTINEIDIANILMLMALFWTLGSFFYGTINQKIHKNKPIVVLSTLLMIVLLFSLAFLNTQNYYFLLTKFCIYGFISAFTLVVLDHYRKLFDSEIFGKVLTAANLFNFGGVFFIQWITGFVIDYLTEKAKFSLQAAFSFAFILVSLLLFLSILFYLKADEDKP